MAMFPRHHELFPNIWRRPVDSPVALYGLPHQVFFCRSCVMSNQRPNSVQEFTNTAGARKQTIAFTDGICDACRFAAEKKKIDWKDRERQMWELVRRFKRTDGGYDCIVAGSGGKDSFYAAHMLRHKYGLNPLTVTWAPHIYTDWGWKNFQAWIHAGFDNHLHTPNGRVQRLLTRLAFENLLHPFQPFVIGQKNTPPQVALQLGIPLVFYGENEAEYGNPRADNQSARRDTQFFTIDDPSSLRLGGQSVADLKAEFGLNDASLLPYMPSSPDAVDRLGLEVHYLGYYERWHPQSCYYYSVEHGGFQASPERTPGTYSKYNSIDDKLDDLHYYTTFIKFGIGRATYDAAQEVRSEDIERDEAVALVRRFDGEFPSRFIDELLAYLSLPEKDFPQASRNFEQPVMDRDYFHDICDRFRSPHLWARSADGQWRLRHAVWHDEAAPALSLAPQYFHHGKFAAAAAN